MKVRVPKPRRTFLEMDEFAALLQAAEDQERSPVLAVSADGRHRTRDRVAVLAATGMRPSAIAAELGLAKSTVTFHLSKLGLANAEPYTGRRAIVETLGRSGVRVSELCDLRIRDARLHDKTGSRFQIADAKTEAGIREVQVTPDLADVLTAHLRRVTAAGYPSGPDAHLFPNHRGGRMTRQRVGSILHEAQALATEQIEAKGRPPMPTTTPHTMRRTYISIALLANGFDVKWVMSQVGHADSKMTMDVYAQLEQRVDRSDGTAFDELVRRARGQDPDDVRDTFGTPDPESPPAEPQATVLQAKKKPANASLSEVARPGLEPGTPRFSVLRPNLSNWAKKPCNQAGLGR